MKIILCVIIVFTSGTIGIIISNKYNKNCSFFSDLHLFFSNLQLKIAFFKNSYTDCLQSFCLDHPQNKFFQNQRALASQNNLSVRSLSLIMPSITDEEKQQVSNIIVSICSSDYESSKNMIDGAIKYCEQKTNEYEAMKKSKGNLIKKIAVCIGLVICIIIY